MSVDNENAAVDIVEFDVDTGAITAAGILSIRQVITSMAARDDWLIGRGSIDGHYVDLATREIRVREPFPAVLTGATLTGMPVPSTLTWRHDTGSGGDVGITDGTVTLDFSVPGIYTVTLSAVMFAPVTYTVEVSK